MRKRLRAKLKAVKAVLITRLNEPIPRMGAYLRAVMTGHMRYYAVPLNLKAIKEFRWGLVGRWREVLSRRSQTANVTWERMEALAKRWIPMPHICHPYPQKRFASKTQGRSRMR